MKTRSGFVSNSSSSSFIISKEAYPTIWDVALAMLAVRNNDSEFYIDDGVLSRLLEMMHIRRQEYALTFPSTNHDTYIWDAKDSWWISTSNNHPFHMLFNRPDVQCKTNTECPMADCYMEDYIDLYMAEDQTFIEI